MKECMNWAAYTPKGDCVSSFGRNRSVEVTVGYVHEAGSEVPKARAYTLVEARP